MQKLTISTRVARTTRLLARIQDHVSSLTPECQDAICHQLDQFYDSLQAFPGLEQVHALIDLAPEPQPPVRLASERPAETIAAHDPALPVARAGVYSQDLVTKEILLSQ